MNKPAPTTPAVELADVTKHYGNGVRALEKVTLRVPAGSICALVGPNGSGKSTVLKLAAGLLEPTAGAVTIAGRPAGSTAARAGIGYLPEAPDYPGWLGVREFLEYCGILSGLEGAVLRDAIEARLEETGLAGLAERRAGTLSKGQRQRLGLAQALLHDPTVLLLDEPADGLDPHGMTAFAGLIGRWREAGRTVLLSSHFLPQVESLCDRAVLLHEGRVIWDGPPGAPGGLAERFVGLVPADAAAR